MGLFDSFKKAVGGVTEQAQQAMHPQHGQGQHAPPPAQDYVEETAEESSEGLDIAGFDPDSDEDGFFDAVLHMESEGEMGGTDESRAQIMARFGIRDRSHWQTVKDSVYHVLIQRHGSLEVVMQREMNFRTGQVQRRMQGAVAAKAASGEMAPVQGITLEAWAAMNAAIIQGANPDDLLKGAGIDKARWDVARAEWEARMARDTTFAIATTYGNAFQNASKGKYAELAKEANAARAENRDLRLPPPLSLEQYYEIMFEQAYAAQQGKEAAAALKSMGLTIIDWTDLSSYMGYHFVRTAGLRHKEYRDLLQKVRARFEAKYGSAKVDVDIAF